MEIPCQHEWSTFPPISGIGLQQQKCLKCGSLEGEKRIVEVMPDYCSTGLWLVLTDKEREDEFPTFYPYHVNVDPEEVGVSPALQFALKYWHEMWEFGIADYDENGEPAPIMSASYIERWIEDGKKLAELMSAENDKYTFVYRD